MRFSDAKNSRAGTSPHSEAQAKSAAVKAHKKQQRSPYEDEYLPVCEEASPRQNRREGEGDKTGMGPVARLTVIGTHRAAKRSRCVRGSHRRLLCSRQELASKLQLESMGHRFSVLLVMGSDETYEKSLHSIRAVLLSCSVSDFEDRLLQGLRERIAKSSAFKAAKTDDEDSGDSSTESLKTAAKSKKKGLLADPTSMTDELLLRFLRAKDFHVDKVGQHHATIDGADKQWVQLFSRSNPHTICTFHPGFPVRKALLPLVLEQH